MLKPIVFALLSFLLPFNSSFSLLTGLNATGSNQNTGTLQKMIVSSGNVSMNLDLNRINGTNISAKAQRQSELRFEAESNSFFTILVFNDLLRGPLPSTMPIIPQDAAALPSKLSESYRQLVVESMPADHPYDLSISDVKSGFIFFNIEGSEISYEPSERLFTARGGRLLISREFARELGRPSDTGMIVGEISISTKMRPIEVTEIVEGEVKSTEMPGGDSEQAGTRPGPDVVVGDVYGLAQFGGSSGGMVGLAVGTNSCNFGTQNLNWFANPDNDHPVIPQNMYRMSGGSNNEERFEQIGQSSVKHAFTALTQDLCALGCNGVGGTRLGSGCSDPYSASLNAGPNLGSRAWINPFTGFYPRNDSATPNNSHTGHSHLGPTHRILTRISDLDTTQNAGATYFAEGQYVTPHEYAWCQSNPSQCNMYNNASYRQYSVTGTTSFSFASVGSTVREKPAIEAWTGSTRVPIEPDPGNDGIGVVAYKVTNPSPGVWHYEYAIYNQNIERGIRLFEVPLGNGATLDNVGFHAPPQHPGSAGDGTAGDAGFSDTPWTQTQTSSLMRWNTETIAVNANANAIRWGTMYNFRFDSNRPPQMGNATIGFYKTGSPITVQVQVPSGPAIASASISGRVLTSSGYGIPRSAVVAFDGTTTRVAMTNSFGYYRFDNLPTGVTYTINVSTKFYNFNPVNIQLNDNITGLNLVAQ